MFHTKEKSKLPFLNLVCNSLCLSVVTFADVFLSAFLRKRDHYLLKLFYTFMRGYRLLGTSYLFTYNCNNNSFSCLLVVIVIFKIKFFQNQRLLSVFTIKGAAM